MTPPTSTPRWNLYLEELTPPTDSAFAKRYRIVMPDPLGNLPEKTGTHTGILMRWPVNPHFTGKETIAKLLSTLPAFSGVSFT